MIISISANGRMSGWVSGARSRAHPCMRMCTHSSVRNRRDAKLAPLRRAFPPLYDSHPRPRNFTSTIAETSRRLSENEHSREKIAIFLYFVFNLPYKAYDASNVYIF